MRRGPGRAVLLGGLLTLGVGCQMTPSGGLPEEVDAPLRAMSKCLADAQEFRFVAQIASEEELENGPLVEYSSEAKVSVRRPDRLHSEIRGDLVRRDAWFDGRTLSVIDLDLGAYAVLEMPLEVRDLDGMLDHLVEEYDLTLPLADFLYRDPYGGMVAAVESSRRVGRHEVDETPCDHLLFRQELIDWQIWIEDGPVPVPRRFLITEKHLPGQPEYDVEFPEWDFAPESAGDEFTFQPPEGMPQIGFAELVGGVTGEGR